MAPRTRAAKEEIDLTLDSDSDSTPAPPPKKKPRTSTRNLKKPAAVQEPILIDDDDDDADRALARQLQEEESQVGGRGDANGKAGPVASGSGSNARPRRNAAPPASPRALLPPPPPPADATDPKALLHPHRAMFLPSRRCPCGKAIASEAFLRPPLSGPHAKREFPALGAVQCDKCAKKMCRGCWEEDGETGGVGQHCAEQRAVILYEVLSALDSTYLVDRLHKPAPKVATPKGRKKAVKPPKGAGAGVGYGSGAQAHHLGMGIGGMMAAFNDYDDEDEEDYYEDFMEEYGYPPPPQPPKVPQALPVPKAPVLAPSHAKDLAEDKVFQLALSLIAELLPHPDAPEPAVYDFLPHASLAPMLALSTLQDLLVNLLRNDSVTEWTRRSEVYFGMLEVLTRLSESEGVLGVLFGKRWEKKFSEGLGEWMEGRGEIEWERKDVPVVAPPKAVGRGKKRKVEVDDDLPPPPLGDVIMGPSVFSLLRRLVTQAEAFRKASVTGEIAAEDVALVGLCGDISAAGDRCVRTLKIWEEHRDRDGGGAKAKPEEEEAVVVNGKGKGKERAVVVEPTTYTDADYSAACRALAYNTIELSVGTAFPTHHYSKEIAASSSSRRPHGGFVHLAKELAILSTSLPPGVFLRVDEARIDVIKCLIAGPHGTPYAGGLFEFDIFIPLAYPQESPKVWLRTTGAGTVRFNPNLYAEGKVCLSILGTWPGSPEEMWQPGSSSILQVLISIQAMILGTNFPYFNEPGFGAAKDSKPSKDYNSNIALATTRHAIIHWTQDEFKDGIWGDVVAMHFSFVRPTISAQIKAWAAKDARMRHWTTTMNHLAGQAQLVSMGHDHHYYAALAAAAQGGRAVVAPPPPVERDLVTEGEEGMDKVAGWRTEAFYRGLLV